MYHVDPHIPDRPSTICVRCTHHRLIERQSCAYHGTGMVHWTENMCHCKETRKKHENFVTGEIDYWWMNCQAINKGDCDHFKQKEETIRTLFEDRQRNVL